MYETVFIMFKTIQYTSKRVFLKTIPSHRWADSRIHKRILWLIGAFIDSIETSNTRMVENNSAVKIQMHFENQDTLELKMIPLEIRQSVEQ